MVRGKAAPTTFYNVATGIGCVVDGDDSTSGGPRKDLERMTQLMKVWYAIEVRAVLGSGTNGTKTYCCSAGW